jgi:curved DNA-binding protein CbpA
LIVDPGAVRTLRITAADGFVLSRIDGRATEKELASLTGLPDAQIRASLDNLFQLKVVAFGPVEATKPPELPGAAGSGGGDSSPAASTLLETAIASLPPDTPELAEEGDLPLDLRRRILGLTSVVASLDHYAILGIPRDTDKKGVKRAYFELAALFHPDRYFRKNLGTFKPKMEVIFAKVSTAYETLTDKEARVEYDLYLGDIEKSRNIEAMLRNVMDEVENAQKSALEFAGEAPAATLPPAPTPSQPPDRTSSPNIATYSVPRPSQAGFAAVVPPSAPAPPPKPSVSDQLRREALARRLGGPRPTKPPPVAAPPPPEPRGPRLSPNEAQDAVKRMWEDRVEAGRRQQADKYAKLAEASEAKNDLTAAAAAYRVALTFLAPDDPRHAHAHELIARSEAALADTYTRQAEHEEKANRWEDAVKSWGRTIKLRPDDHRTLERYAHALLRTNGDLHAAAQYAQRAVALAPTNGDYRCTLASVYQGAGLALNAKRELEAAALQFPDNPNIRALMKKLSAPPPK